MSVGMIVLLVVVAVAALVVGHAIAYSQSKKRFGLKEAKAAARYVGNSPDSARAIMGVVLGVLGYKNTVAEDVHALAEEMTRENESSAVDIADNDAQIERLSAKNHDLQDGIAANEAEVADAHQVAALFQG